MKEVGWEEVFLFFVWFSGCEKRELPLLVLVMRVYDVFHCCSLFSFFEAISNEFVLRVRFGM